MSSDRVNPVALGRSDVFSLSYDFILFSDNRILIIEFKFTLNNSVNAGNRPDHVG